MPRFTVLETSALFSNRIKYDYLFEMEMWLKGVEKFFVLDCLPLSPFERSHASLKNYVEEVSAVRSGVGHLAFLTTHLLGEGKEDLASFLLYLDSQVMKGAPASPAQARRRPGAETELALVIEKLDDFARILDELSRVPFVPLQLYLSLGRIVVGTLKQDPNLGVLFRENLRPVLDRASKQSLSRVLSAVDPAQKGALAAIFVELFKGLRYAEVIRETIASPATAKKSLLLFALLKSQTESLVAFVRRRVLPRYPTEGVVGESLERLVFAAEMEVKKVMEVELVDVVLMKDPKLVFARLEDASGILRDLFQQSIIGLAEAFSPDVDGRALFADFRTRLEQSLKLRDALWALVQASVAFQKAPEKKTLKALVSELDAFRRGAMRHLMFKDWSLFERFHAGFSRERPPKAFLPAAHQFEVFLRTLVREVGKRSVLAAHPFRFGKPAEPSAEGGGGAPRYN